MALKFSKVERAGPVTIVTISRPEVLNAVHYEVSLELEKVFDGFAADPDQWVAIVTGAGNRSFCAGADLKWLAAGGKWAKVKSGFGGLSTRFDCDKPIIAAVNGYAMGGGFEMALACDLIVAAENAVFSLPEPRVGLAALPSAVLLLAQQIGTKRAMDIILTGRCVSAREGHTMGFVNHVVPEGQALATALQLAEAICENSPMAIRASKQALQRGLGRPIEQAIAEQDDYPAVTALFKSQDYIEGPTAFAERRAPKWVGQ
ncbi:enoyl-CoA hydratase-related protein [Bradyrhizobium huanghuaihaiense]|uniref:enoyl-CoA hydratase-related protein n=1 Tax=Bradyrhizobium huanghuaihaiense TaxID=990078 RepID=UPI0021AA5027|nr:enoyl-CoA hydratase-related protein [Bradyrhizobium sp. CB3035]UWU75837.1 enoyl-CoA hydratase-related protein [Bradyrhizobium sp. CB3035]